MHDPTEDKRAILQAVANAITDEVIADISPQTWTTEELQRDFTVEGFMAPYVIVTRKADGVRGTLMFRHSPRVYFDFATDRA